MFDFVLKVNEMNPPLPLRVKFDTKKLPISPVSIMYDFIESVIQ